MDKFFKKNRSNKEGVSIIDRVVLTVIVAILVEIQVAVKQAPVTHKQLIPSTPDTNIIIGRRHGN